MTRWELLHEIWEEVEDGCRSIELRIAGPSREALPLNSKARLLGTLRAASHFEAMQRYYTFMDWGNYHPEPDWDDIFYTHTEFVEQRRWLKSQEEASPKPSGDALE